MIKIYHNARCRKSREGLEKLKMHTSEIEVRYYIKEPLTYLEILELLKKLDIIPIDLVRTNEKIWKEEFKGKQLSDEQIVEAMESYPQLIQRPIIVYRDRAIIGRPLKNIDKIIDSQ